MQPAVTKAGGQCATTGPVDVCKTPSPNGVAPMPYPNLAMCAQAKGSTCSQKVKIENQPPFTKKTEISRSSGDEPGVQKGVMSSTQMDAVVFKQSTSKVKIEGAPAVVALMATAHNGSNANAPPGAAVSPSQMKVLITP